MHEKIKKWGKIILVSAIALIAFGLVASFFVAMNFSKSSALRGISAPGEYDKAAMNLGLSYDASEEMDYDSIENTAYSNPRTQSGGGENIYQDGALTIKKIIKNGSLTLYVKDAEIAAKQIQDLALSVDGFVAESNIRQTSSGYKSGSITIRVPASRFEQVMNSAKAIAQEVEQENISAQDVTEEYIDLEAQIKNLKAEEVQYQEIMRKSFTIEDTLKVSNRLSDVRGRIERAQGRLNYLSRQVDMSTIRVSLTAEGDVKVFGLKWRPLVVIKRSFKNMLSGLTDYIDAMISFLFRLPVILLWLATISGILYIIFLIIRRFYNKILKKQEEK